MAKWVALTARKLKPGTYDDWREAWGSRRFDGPCERAATCEYLPRDVNDPGRDRRVQASIESDRVARGLYEVMSSTF